MWVKTNYSGVQTTSKYKEEETLTCFNGKKGFGCWK